MVDALQQKNDLVQNSKHRRRLIFVPLLVALAVALIFYQFYQQQVSIQRQDAERMFQLRGRRIAAQIEHSIDARLSRGDGLMHVVAIDPEITNDEFAAYAERLIESDPGIRSTGLIDGNVIRAVFPLEGNESAIGKNLLDVPDQAPAVRLMMETRKPVLAGPLNLVQGGRAFVYRVPVLLPNPEINDPAQAESYWGNVALVVEHDLLLRELESLIPDDVQASLHRSTLDEGSIQPLFGNEMSVDDRPAEIYLDVPGVDWVLYLRPKGGWPNRLPDHVFRVSVGLFVSALSFVVAWMMLRSHFIQTRSVSELRAVQQAMQVSQDRLKLALDRGNIAIWEWDSRGRQLRFSETYEAMVHAENVSNPTGDREDWESRLHPEEKSKVTAALHDFLTTTDDHYQSEYRLRCGDGSFRWFRAEASTTTPTEVGQRRVMGVLIDITDDREIRQRLQDERRETQLILDSIPSLVILQDAHSRILRVNQAVVEATGVERDELAGKTVDEVLPGCGVLEKSHESGIIRCKDLRSADVRVLGDRWVQTQRIALHNSRGWADRNIIVSTDITDLKRAEQLQERANRFQSKVGELALIGGWELNCVTQELTWSDRVKQIHEVSPDYQPDVATAIDFYRSDAREQVQRVIERAIEEGARWDIKLPLVTAKGRQIYVRAMGQPVFENGRCVTIWGVFQDVTQMHRENELRESLFRNAPNAYLLFNEDGILECNPKAVQMLGAESKEELLCRHPADFSPEYQPCGTPSAEKCKVMDALAHKRGVHRFEWSHQRLNGDLFPCEVTLSHVEADSKPSLLAAWRDLSGLKAAERERDSFFVLSPDLFCVVDANGCFKRVNSAWNQVAVPDVDLLIGSRVADLMMPAHQDSTERMLRDLTTQKRITEFRNQVKWIDGSIRWLEWNAKASADDQQVYFAVARDVTQRILSEQQLSSLNQELNASNKALRQSNLDLQQFVYVASHDLQTPLRGVAGFVDLLSEEYTSQLDETAKGYLGRISAGTKRMQQLIRDLVKYSRIEVQTGEQNLAQLKPLSLNQILDDCLLIMHSEIEAKGAEVIREDLPTIPGDASQIAQLFTNLISNAIKYNSSETPRVHVKAAVVPSGFDGLVGRSIEITVQDNGIGIAPKFHEQVFEVFRRLHTDREYSGTGIGLAICKRVMQRHGGKIWVSSEPGSGTCFHLRFPVGNETHQVETAR